MSTEGAKSPKVILLSDYRNSPLPNQDGGTLSGAESPLESDDARSRLTLPKASFEDVYPGISETAPGFYASVTAVSQLRQLADTALQHLKAGDVYFSDDLVNRMIVELPVVFQSVADYPSISLLCTSLFHGLRNRRGEPLGVDELKGVIETLESISREPFMTFNSALQIVERLDDIGFDCLPSFVDPIIEESSDDESIR